MLNNLKKAIVFFILLSGVGVSTFAAGEQESVQEYSGEEGRITVYLSGAAAMLDKLEAEFERENGDVLEFVHMGCGPLRQRVWAEMESGGIRADVFWGSDPLVYISLDEQGALEEYVPAEASALRPGFISERNYTLVNERYGVVIYNRENIDTVPESFNDLLDDRFRGALCHADPAQSSTALALISGLWNLTGSDGNFYRELKDNGLFLTKKNSDVPSKIQEGEFDAGIAPHDAVLRLQKKAKKEGYPTPLELAWPSEGAVAIQRPIAISKNDARPEVNSEIAHRFVDFMISKKAQAITTQFGFVSVRSDLPLPAGVPADLKKLEVQWEQLAERQNIINDDFKKFFK